MDRSSVPAGAPWDEIVGYSRAVRAGGMIHVSGTTASNPDGGVLCPGDAAGQTRIALERIGKALEALGSSFADVVETRLYVTDISRWQEYGRVHGEFFGKIRPANAMIEVKSLIDPGMLVEITAVAVAR